MKKLLMNSSDSVLLVVDVQEKLWPYIANKEEVRNQCCILIQGAEALGVPILISEQYPKGLGPTLTELRAVQPKGARVFEKMSFGLLEEPSLVNEIKRLGRKQLVICGIESHVCILQSALMALEKGYNAAVVADAIGSREEANRQIALGRIRTAGALVVSTEMILFEWMRSAKHKVFKEISSLIK